MDILLTVLFSFLVMAASIAAMSIGVLARRAPIRGSCGGLNSGSCELCSEPCQRKK